MKKLIVNAFLFLIIAISLNVSYGADFSGTWTGNYGSTWYLGHSGEITLTISQVGNNLNVNITITNTDFGTIVTNLSGTASGNTLYVSGSWFAGGYTGSVDANGTLSGNTITGNWDFYVDGYGQYDHGTFHVVAESYQEPSGYVVNDDLRIGAIIHTVEKGEIEALWHEGGREYTARGDMVIWGYFYANPNDVTWGSENNPDLYVKIWYDHSGRIDVNFFFVSVPDISVYSDYLNDGSYDNQGTTTLSNRYIRHEYWR